MTPAMNSRSRYALLVAILLSIPFFGCGGAFTVVPQQDRTEDGGDDPDGGAGGQGNPGQSSPTGHADGATSGDGGGSCAVASTPILGNIQGPIGGLSFEVAHATTLTSFDFAGSGVQDTVELVDSANPCEPLASVSIPAHISSAYAAETENVSWPLQAGKTYYLVSVSGQVAFKN